MKTIIVLACVAGFLLLIVFVCTVYCVKKKFYDD
jgi:hypothetical protein